MHSSYLCIIKITVDLITHSCYNITVIEKTKLLLTLMFDTNERICVSDSQFSSHSLLMETVLGEAVTLVSPNEKVPPKTIGTDRLILVALNPMKNGFRNDSNCCKYRNFLIELDISDRNSQIGYIKHLKIPYSAMVWSGSKSTHTLISISELIPDEKTYRFLYKWILNIVNLADQALGNPSRSIRLPGTIRPETGKEQELIELKERIPLSELMAWLNRYPHLKPMPKPKRESLSSEPDYSKLSIWARSQLKNGINFSKGRNAGWYALAYDFALAGFDLDTTTEILLSKFQEESDFKEREVHTAIGSAFKNVEENK